MPTARPPKSAVLHVSADLSRVTGGCAGCQEVQKNRVEEGGTLYDMKVPSALLSGRVRAALDRSIIAIS